MKDLIKNIFKSSEKRKSILFLALFFFTTTVAKAQHLEWQNILNLLKKEANYFQGKEGFIQLGKSDFNLFSIEDITVNDSMISLSFWLSDRFENEHFKQLVKETVLLDSEPTIVSANIFYDYIFYFKNYSELQFLKLELEDKLPLTYHVLTIREDLRTGKQKRGEQEGKTNTIIIPVRAKNRGKILKAIDAYQRLSTKPQLDYETWH